MLSRVAENLYWISRYAERADGLARLLEDAYSMELEVGAEAVAAGPLDNVLLVLGASGAMARHAAAGRAVPLPPGRPVPRTGGHDEPGHQRPLPRARRLRRDRLGRGRALGELAQKHVRLRGVPGAGPRAGRPARRRRLPAAGG